MVALLGNTLVWWLMPVTTAFQRKGMPAFYCACPKCRIERADCANTMHGFDRPNEHDLVLTSNGTLVMIVRLDAGDGPITHPFLNYYRTISVDQG